mmetsp:Transcript_69009/g.173856  ORF Transcript_69009/g.173856 Transcript_69009/m.173856 type:complete len:803 (-) Transcript_69009:190-2598(-)
MAQLPANGSIGTPARTTWATLSSSGVAAGGLEASLAPETGGLTAAADLTETANASVETAFQVELRKTAARLEALIEAERKQRRLAFTEQKRDIERQELLLAGLTRKHDSTSSSDCSSSPSQDVPEGQSLAAALRAEFEVVSARCESKTQALSIELDMQKVELVALRGSLSQAQEKLSQQDHWLEDFQAKNQIIMQSAGELGCGIEEVANAVISIEQKLRQEIDVLHKDVLESGANRCTEIVDAFERRDQVSSALRSQVDTMQEQLEECRSMLHSHPEANDLDALRKLVEHTRGDLASLQAAVADDHEALAKVAADQVANAGVADVALAGQPSSAPSVSTTEMQEMVDELRCMRDRLHALDAVRQGAAGVAQLESRVGALEVLLGQSGMPSASPQASTSEAELKNSTGLDFQPLVMRVEQLEVEVQKVVGEQKPLGTRIEQTESELQKLSGATTGDLEVLRTEVDALKCHFIATRSTTTPRTCSPMGSPKGSATLLSSSVGQAAQETVPVQDCHTHKPDQQGAGVASEEDTGHNVCETLQRSISNLVQKVNQTLAQGPLPSAQGVQQLDGQVTQSVDCANAEIPPEGRKGALSDAPVQLAPLVRVCAPAAAPLRQASPVRQTSHAIPGGAASRQRAFSPTRLSVTWNGNCLTPNAPITQCPQAAAAPTSAPTSVPSQVRARAVSPERAASPNGHGQSNSWVPAPQPRAASPVRAVGASVTNVEVAVSAGRSAHRSPAGSVSLHPHCFQKRPPTSCGSGAPSSVRVHPARSSRGAQILLATGAAGHAALGPTLLGVVQPGQRKS